MEFRKSRFSQSSEAKTHELPLVDSRLSETFTVEDENLTILKFHILGQFGRLN